MLLLVIYFTWKLVYGHQECFFLMAAFYECFFSTFWEDVRFPFMFLFQKDALCDKRLQNIFTLSLMQWVSIFYTCRKALVYGLEIENKKIFF